MCVFSLFYNCNISIQIFLLYVYLMAMCYLFIRSQCHQICIVSQIADRIMPKWSNAFYIVSKNIRSVGDVDNVSYTQQSIYYENFKWYIFRLIFSRISVTRNLSDASYLKISAILFKMMFVKFRFDVLRPSLDIVFLLTKARAIRLHCLNIILHYLFNFEKAVTLSLYINKKDNAILNW